MTAPSRIPHGEAVRNAVRVEWMRLRVHSDLGKAWGWARAHGMHVDFYSSDGIRLTDPAGARIVARLGERLAYAPSTGEFSTWSEERWQAMHGEVNA